MKKILMVMVAVAVLGGSPALAADMALKDPPPSCMWCGLYIGGNAGGVWSRDSINTSSLVGPIPPFFAIDNASVSAAASSAINTSGFTGGEQIGYNWQTNNWVWGVESDFDYLGLTGTRGGRFPFPSTLPGAPNGPIPALFTVATNYSTNWLFTLRPRVGWAVNNWLLYVTGGLAVSRQSVSQTLTLLPPFVDTNSFSKTQVGGTIGAGVEYALNHHWSIKAEYLYVDLGTTSANPGTLTPACPPGLCTYTNTTAVHLTANIARAGFNYHW
jgi:outer membrane immunogenic protein